MGFDNIKFNNFESFIHLTTVNQPLYAMGRYIAESLIKQIETESHSEEKLFQTTIIEGETV
jgi:DNA-binding LacI/PurR family transcriptional regulator